MQPYHSLKVPSDIALQQGNRLYLVTADTRDRGRCNHVAPSVPRLRRIVVVPPVVHQTFTFGDQHLEIPPCAKRALNESRCSCDFYNGSTVNSDQLRPYPLMGSAVHEVTDQGIW